MVVALERLVHYVICLGVFEQVLVITNNVMTLVYTYAKFRLKNPPDIFHKIEHTG